MSEQQSRSRAEFLKADYAETFRLAGIMVDWRATSVWALLTGLTALAGAIAIARPVAWFGFVVVIGVSVVFGVYRHRLASTTGERLVALTDEAEADTSWDRTGMTEIPHHYLYPADVATPADLERLLRIAPADLRAQRDSTRAVRVAVYIAVVLAMVALATTVTAIVMLFADFDSPAGLPTALVLFATVLTSSAPLVEVQRFVSLSRRQARVIVQLSVVELPRLWAVDSNFDGVVVRKSNDGYVLDQTQMSVPPDESKLSPNPRRFALALGVVVAVGGLVAVIAGVVVMLGLT